jgi:hypothetical protein
VRCALSALLKQQSFHSQHVPLLLLPGLDQLPRDPRWVLMGKATVRNPEQIAPSLGARVRKALLVFGLLISQA